MSIRVTVNELKDIINTSIDAKTLLNTFIATASLIVDEDLSDLDPTLTDARLKRIELYLAGHFTAITEESGGLTSTSMDNAKDTVANVYKAGYGSTRYGMMALTLDTSGTLKRLGAPTLKAEFRVV